MKLSVRHEQTISCVEHRLHVVDRDSGDAGAPNGGQESRDAGAYIQWMGLERCRGVRVAVGTREMPRRTCGEWDSRESGAYVWW